MFLVSAQSHQMIEPIRRSIRDVAWRHPVRLRIAHWDLRASDMWFVRGNSQVLQVISDLLCQPPEVTGDDSCTISSRVVLIHAEASTAAPQSFWQRLFRRAETPTLSEEASALIARWYAEGIGLGDTLERRVVERIATAVTSDDCDILLLDRVQRFLRPQVRFRVSAALRELAGSQGITLVALSEKAPDSWIAIDRRAWVRRGVFDLVQRLGE